MLCIAHPSQNCLLAAQQGAAAQLSLLRAALQQKHCTAPGLTPKAANDVTLKLACKGGKGVGLYIGEAQPQAGRSSLPVTASQSCRAAQRHAAPYCKGSTQATLCTQLTCGGEAVAWGFVGEQGAAAHPPEGVHLPPVQHTPP